jgi:hypothetical protein
MVLLGGLVREPLVIINLNVFDDAAQANKHTVGGNVPALCICYDLFCSIANMPIKPAAE